MPRDLPSLCRTAMRRNHAAELASRRAHLQLAQLQGDCCLQRPRVSVPRPAERSAGAARVERRCSAPVRRA
eukprot:215419-Chlamydomonas_euryale.AAC.16